MFTSTNIHVNNIKLTTGTHGKVRSLHPKVNYANHAVSMTKSNSNMLTALINDNDNFGR